ncbi:class I SAM-dependent methyltransferase [Paraburkholderia aspalathi]|uniref:class I SAM-dependent methyltransferase n=1 Tax=Paraburkholderia aspalathi TaxID=1324617 RepID=UPI0038BDAE9D
MNMRETGGASASALRYHYDVSNDFYALWLGPSMAYSCAQYEDMSADLSADILESAQRRKLRTIVGQAAVKQDDRVLDIGCGWGTLISSLVHEHGAAQAVGLTMSNAQIDWHATRESDPRVSVLLQDWRDHEPEQKYDAIVSVEALEHFVRPGLEATERHRIYRDLFERCHAWLEPGGSMCFQFAAYGNSGPQDLDPFISQQIFPETDIARIAEIALAIERLFEIRLLVNERYQYVRTLRAWLRGLKHHRVQAVDLVGEATVSRYERYLQLCTYIFASGSCDLHRITFRRIDHLAGRANR